MSIVDKTRFKDGHYIGLPADYNDLFVRTRVELAKEIPGFLDKNATLVDVGCGNGNTVFLLAPFFKKSYGIDIFPENKKLFEEAKKEKGCNNCEFVLQNMEETEEVEKYDRLVCYEVIEHFKSEDTVGKLFQVLKKGGKLAITVPHKWWVFETHGAKLPLLPWNRVLFFSFLPRPIHEKYANARIYTKRRILKLLKKHGFKVQKAVLMTAPLDVMKDSKLKRFLLKYIFKGPITKNPFLATNVFVYAEKE
jgi:2-polyprenyl-3-methyl-5-hydroxy-6-metoxy-1,4-benzoquinol methylase